MSLGIEVAVGEINVVGGRGDGVVAIMLGEVIKGEALVQAIKRLVNKTAVLPIVFFIVMANLQSKDFCNKPWRLL